VRQAVEAAQHATGDRRIHEEVLRRFLRVMAESDLSLPTPFFIGILHRVVRELTGNPDPYLLAKARFNQTALERYAGFKKLVEQAESPVETALRLATAGNMIDMIVDGGMEGTDIGSFLEAALSSQLSRTGFNQFMALVDQSQDILYLGDNAGEIVFDRLLIEQLPREKITFVVRGGPVINDVTMEDARFCGLTELVEVTDTGTDFPGALLDLCSDSFRGRFRRADLVIAKGQGNFEALSEVRQNIVFVFKAKCEVIRMHLGCEIGSPVLLVKTL